VGWRGLLSICEISGDLQNLVGFDRIPALADSGLQRILCCLDLKPLPRSAMALKSQIQTPPQPLRIT
jgi:hypothetical protein